VLSITGNADVIFENFDIQAKQYGTGFTINYNPSDKINTKFFGTYQKTRLYGRTEIENNVNAVQFGETKEDHTRTMDVFSFISATNWSKKLTPSFYGGFYFNYKYTSHWNFSTDAYFYSKQRFADFDYNNILSDYSGVFNNYYMDIKSNIVLNAKASYQINKKAKADLTIKNILGEHREFGYADQIGRLYLIGFEWSY
jgi:iron complex outermembrane receptor protein